VGNNKKIVKYSVELTKRFKKEMPRIKKEIKIYEEKVASGQVTLNPISGPQFNV